VLGQTVVISAGPFSLRKVSVSWSRSRKLQRGRSV